MYLISLNFQRKCITVLYILNISKCVTEIIIIRKTIDDSNLGGDESILTDWNMNG